MSTTSATTQLGTVSTVTRIDACREEHTPGPAPTHLLDQPPAAGDSITLPGGGAVVHNRIAGTVEVRIVGEVDFFDRSVFNEVFAVLESETAPSLYVLADEATFIETACLDAIARTAVVRERAGGRTVVCGLREPFATAWSEANRRWMDRGTANLDTTPEAA